MLPFQSDFVNFENLVSFPLSQKQEAPEYPGSTGKGNWKSVLLNITISVNPLRQWLSYPVGISRFDGSVKSSHLYIYVYEHFSWEKTNFITTVTLSLHMHIFSPM